MIVEHDIVKLTLSGGQDLGGVCKYCLGWYPMTASNTCTPGVHDFWAPEEAKRAVEKGWLPPDFPTQSSMPHNLAFIVTRLY